MVCGVPFLVLLLAGASAVVVGRPQGETCGFSPGTPTDSAPPNLEAALQEAKRRPDLAGPAGDLRSWFRACDAGAARNAIRILRNTLESKPRDSLVRLLTGAALARGPEVQVPGAAGYLHRLTHHFSNSEREARRLLLAASREAGSAEAALELAALALGTRDRETLKDAATALAAVLRERGDPELLVALAEVLLGTGQVQDARRAANQALAAGDSRGQRALAISMMRSGGRADDAGSVYLSQLAAADRAIVALYFEDIAPLLTPVQAAEWHRLSDSGKGVWIHREWEWRASTAGVSVGERIAEHHRRLAAATQRYQRVANRGPRPEGALGISGEFVRSPFDDRGIVFIRHGQPAEVIRASPGSTGLIREAWVYPGLGNGRGLFEFAKPPGYGDYVLAAPLRCEPFLYMFGEGGQRGEVLFEAWVRSGGTADASIGKGYPTLSSGRAALPGAQAAQAPAADWRQRFETVYLDYAASLGRYDPTLADRGLNCVRVAQMLAQTGPGNIRSVLGEISFLNAVNHLDERAALRAVDQALATETGPRLFARPLRVVLSLYEFLRNGEPELTAFAGVPGSDVASKVRAGEFHYGLRLSLAIEDDRSRTVARVDTTLAFRMPRKLVAADLVRASISLPRHAAGHRTVRVVIADVNEPARGQILAGTRALGINAAALELSDIVIAEPRAGPWSRGGERLAPIPGHQVAAGSAFRLFHELYGARAGDTIRVRVEVSPGSGEGVLARVGDLISHRYAMALAFDEVAMLDADGVARVGRELRGDLRPGAYVLRVVVQNRRTGESAARSTELIVL